MAVLQGIRHFFAASGHDFPIAHPHIRMLLKGISRLDTPRHRKAPVSIELLEACFYSFSFDSPFEQALWGVLCLAFFFLLRRSEIVAINSSTFKWSTVRAQDIVVMDDRGQPTVSSHRAQSVYLRLIGSKTNQVGVLTTRMLSRPGHPFLCPVFGALILLQARKNLPVGIPAAVYMSAMGTPACISTSHVADIIKRAAAKPAKIHVVSAPTPFALVAPRTCIAQVQTPLPSNSTVVGFRTPSRHTPGSARSRSLHCPQTW